ncbi:Lactonase, 7-bladed beta-propeller-domain-containing protein [Rhypophila decipiens]|uniref:Lactonase, 7-bladed beta-propeller-domain-containing protein n=1 Tax=Rhypophila decipiens TaxID=261697 RepID=A0AAN6XZT8_9PEZI|nr:Lactonase, 7-bladed beta-propeller-domain-containing protein [Rhypophila decipiens]
MIKRLLLLAPAAASAQIIYATSYNNHALTTLNLDVAKGSLAKLGAEKTDCGSEPTWLTLDAANSVLYCLNEGWGGAASITSYKASAASGALETLDILPVLKSPVSATLFGANNSRLAVAYYDTSSFGTFSVSNPKDLILLGQQNYTLASPGPVPDRQDAPHLHDAVLDPTGKFVLVPDLGSDLLRLFKVDGSALAASAAGVVKTPAGAGPRHAAFAVSGRGANAKTYLYSFNELSNSVTGYSVVYKGDGTPEFTQLFDIPSHGPGTSVPAGTKAAEIEVSPDQKFVILSSRGENSLDIPAFDGSNSTIKSDPLVTFSIDAATGKLTLVQVAPAGGRNPRGFSLNKRGDLLVSALQDDNRVVVYQRDVRSGKLGKVVASATVGEGANNGPNYALFYE